MRWNVGETEQIREGETYEACGDLKPGHLLGKCSPYPSGEKGSFLHADASLLNGVSSPH